MRRQYLLLIAAFALATALVASSACRKERSMTLIVTAKMLGDTNQLVPNAKVVLEKESIRVEGFTDAKGQFRHSFNLQIQLDITITKDTLKGIGIVNLGDHGVDVEKSIYLF